MPSTTSKPATSDTKSADAIAMLTADHKLVKGLFNEFEKLCKQDDVDEQKSIVVQKICDELTVHAQVEEEFFYPAMRDAIDEPDLLDEAEVEHTTAKDLIAQIEGMSSGDELYDAKVTVLGEYIAHHVEEEEGEMFPKARKADLDTKALGVAMMERKNELKIALGIEDAEGAASEPPLRTKGNARKPSSKSAN